VNDLVPASLGAPEDLSLRRRVLLVGEVPLRVELRQ
jgi:hypothetical protein